jgi:hypothetical protein
MRDIQDIFIFSEVILFGNVLNNVYSNEIYIDGLEFPVNIIFTDGDILVNGISSGSSTIVDNSDTVQLVISNLYSNVFTTYYILISNEQIEWSVGIFDISTSIVNTNMSNSTNIDATQSLSIKASVPVNIDIIDVTSILESLDVSTVDITSILESLDVSTVDITSILE